MLAHEKNPLVLFKDMRRYYAAIKALLRRYEGAIKALLCCY